MYYLDLFSGIGGFALGAYWAGLRFDGHYFSEVDDYAIRIYQQRFPDAVGLGDICKIRGADLPAGDWIIAGGFPCQDISVAGKGAGLAGARSGLWFEYARLIGELRPRFAIMENVGALTHRGLDRVLGSLAEIGYDAEWQDIRASDVGAPHRRERIWIVAYPGLPESSGRNEVTEGQQCGDRRAAWGELASCGCDVADAAGSGFSLGGRPGRPEGEAETGAGMESESQRRRKALADADSSGCERARQAQPAGWLNDSKPARGGSALADSTHGGDVRRDGELGATQGEVREHRGSPSHGSREWWAAEPDVGRVAHGVPARVDRLKCLGNSIVPQIAELIFREIRRTA